MHNVIIIPDNNGQKWFFRLNFSNYSPHKKIKVNNVCIIQIYKFHDHRYDIKCFFYKKEYIYYQERIRSKKELYSAIQELLQENL